MVSGMPRKLAHFAHDERLAVDEESLSWAKTVSALSPGNAA